MPQETSASHRDRFAARQRGEGFFDWLLSSGGGVGAYDDADDLYLLEEGLMLTVVSLAEHERLEDGDL